MMSKPFLKICLLFLVALLILSNTGFSQSQDNTHIVKSGETLFGIANKYEITVEQLREWNGLSGNELNVGQTLIVGREKEDKEATIHEVEAQETLFSISKQYNVSIAEIKSWNDLVENDLEIGQQLKIYPPKQSDSTSQEQVESLIINTPAKSNTYYTVKSGDTLYKIAADHNMTVDELKALNDLTSNTIRVGQQLTVNKPETTPSVSRDLPTSTPQGKFAIYKITKKQSLEEILTRFNMDEAEFHALNPEVDDQIFLPGRSLTVLVPPSKTYENPYTVEASLKNLGDTFVTVYDSARTGTPTTSGELYNPDQLTAAHTNIELGNVIFIENPQNNKGIYVRINDRFAGNGLKLSNSAYIALEFSGADSATVNIYQDQ